ncbi:MAG TPA: saccharopine dehydrogenase NADP-binding domain-containing protein [Burkholderiales bacterium]|nr:saccharopine dehydrogenase NADP-binding domain-containing protein [Burkholderiales bacterium]
MSELLDVIVFGATGFTGRLVAEYLYASYGVGGELAWAMAGRNLDKLAKVHRQIGAGEALPLIAADASDAGALAGLVRQSRSIIATVGPYQRHGRGLVTACAQAGTDYVDLCGEPAWMAQMIPALAAPARASGARIVFSCGFDSIPFDLGVVFLQDEARRRFGVPLIRVRGRVRRMKGKPSGGTIASLLATVEQMGLDPAAARTMADPFALTPGFRGPAQPEGESVAYDDVAKAWTGPFIMAPINTKNVHRTNALLGHPWGRDFVYDERMLTGDGAQGERRARALARTTRIQNRLLAFAPTRALLRRFALPKPGEGPDAEERASGGYDLLFIGQSADGRTLRASVRGDRDPGYGSTSKMISESALCLVRDVGRTETGGGVWTPGAAMGLKLVARLQAHAGLTFAIEG